jgi:hypothetical protein
VTLLQMLGDMLTPALLLACSEAVAQLIDAAVSEEVSFSSPLLSCGTLSVLLLFGSLPTRQCKPRFPSCFVLRFQPPLPRGESTLAYGACSLLFSSPLFPFSCLPAYRLRG